MSVNTFQAKIALDQWFGQPFMPPVEKLAAKLKSDGFVNKAKPSSGSFSAPIEIDDKILTIYLSYPSTLY